MDIFLNDMKIRLVSGMTVRHALTAAGIGTAELLYCRVFDEWGNETGLSGELAEGMRIYARCRENRIFAS